MRTDNTASALIFFLVLIVFIFVMSSLAQNDPTDLYPGHDTDIKAGDYSEVGAIMELLIAMSIVIGFIIFLALGTWAEGQIDLRVGSYIKFRRNFEYRFDKYYVEGQSGYITRIEINSVGWPVYHVDINGQEVKFDWASASNVIRLRDPRKSKSKHN